MTGCFYDKPGQVVIIISRLWLWEIVVLAGWDKL